LEDARTVVTELARVGAELDRELRVRS